TNEFINGQSPMLTGGYWQKASMVKKHLESFAVAPAPSGPAGRVLKWVVGAYSIPKASADPVLALQWVGHLTSVPWATEWVKRGLNPAGRMDVNRMAQFQADPVHKAWSSFFDDQAAVLNWPPNLRYDEVNKAWQAAIDRVAKGQMAPQASLQQLDHDVKVILAEPKLTVALP
ncbi:MAG TPA: hypothetical protein VFK80_07550, partial [Limnochordia bacterium]|nr:hypothetical protein [Limnochordia bacterium]